MPLPVGQQRDQQVRAPQQRGVGRGHAAERDVVTAAGAAVRAVDVERLGRKPGQPGLLVEGFQLLTLFREAGGRRDVDLDDPGVGGDRHRRQPRVRRGTVALDHYRAVDLGDRGLDSGRQVDEMFERLGGRQEDVQQPAANFGDQGGRRCGFGVLDLRLQRAGLRRQRPPDRHRVEVERHARRPPADRIQRQPQTRRRIPLEQHDAAAAQPPIGARPTQVVVSAVQRQHERHRCGDGLVEAAQQRGATGGAVVRPRSSLDSTGSPSGIRTLPASLLSASS